jgi:hypothetical protein
MLRPAAYLPHRRPRQHPPCQRRQALLVGISDYPGEDEDLGGGPLNDVALMRDLLTTRLGFAEANVQTLIDGQATRANIVAAFRTHLAKAGRTGVAVFYFSGHGTQLPNKSSDSEEDGLDEVIVVRASTPESINGLLDEELGVLANELSTDRVLVILDNCYSGTGTRAPGKAVHWRELGGVGAPPSILRSTGAPGSGPRMKRLRSESIDARMMQRTQLVRSTGPMEPARHLLLSAPAEDELSLNIPLLLDDGTRASIGLLTGSLYAVLLRSDLTRVTFEDLVDSLRSTSRGVVARLRAGPQTPQIEGSRRSAIVASFFHTK